LTTRIESRRAVARLHEPLQPDACRSDPSAPCRYYHLLLRALNGERDRLSARELEFVGILPPRRRGDGWHQPNEIRFPASVDERDVDAGTVAILQALVKRDRLEFLG
jgi:hypothetical protein